MTAGRANRPGSSARSPFRCGRIKVIVQVVQVVKVITEVLTTRGEKRRAPPDAHGGVIKRPVRGERASGNAANRRPRVFHEAVVRRGETRSRAEELAMGKTKRQSLPSARVGVLRDVYIRDWVVP